MNQKLTQLLFLCLACLALFTGIYTKRLEYKEIEKKEETELAKLGYNNQESRLLEKDLLIPANTWIKVSFKGNKGDYDFRWKTEGEDIIKVRNQRGIERYGTEDLNILWRTDTYLYFQSPVEKKFTFKLIKKEYHDDNIKQQ